MTQQPALPSSLFQGHVDHFTNGTIRGWAFNLQDISQPVRVHVLIDRQEIMQVLCDTPRGDVRDALELPTDTLGFEFCLPEQFFDHQPHSVALRFPDRSALPLPNIDNADILSETVTFPGFVRPEICSFVDGVRDDVLRGWIIHRPTPYADWQGGMVVSATADGINLGSARANGYRADVADSLKCDPNCGFEILLPRHLYDRHPHHFSVVAEPDKTELTGSPFTTSLVHDVLESRLIDLEATINQLHRDLTAVRREVSTLVPRRAPNLQRYDSWVRRYYSLLSEKVATQQRAHPLPKKAPLVTVLCPTYRPNGQDFRAAIASVTAQTYAHWELIIIDDGSANTQTTATIQDVAASDARIRVLTLPKNQGISEATNAGIRSAKGAYIAFFDHDDLLVPVALEVMVRAALENNAKLLYCDEDKIDAAGHFLEPNLKPAFDYRYLLGCNYICHLTMIATDTVKKVGFFNARYDGAQDHDYMLRCTEVLDASEIHHVPAILYHWRKTPNSTAARITHKEYAVKAGVDCVQAHLTRMKRRAKVKAINNLTLYHVEWHNRRRPSISVIIPFRDQAATTRRCVESLLSHVSYRNLHIILVDNFSVQDDTQTFLKEISTNPHVSVLRVEEPFNFSRLNNLAAAQCKSDFLFFLNNDVFITQDDFLSTMIAEALATPNVGAVAPRLLYPNETIQHAGVAVGPDVIGVHVHRAQPHDAYGYVGRLRLTHEVTAVSAAAMLVRRTLFEELGGFDEHALAIAYNDVDLCLKIRQAGHKIIYCADVEAEHHESFSRGTDDKPENEPRFFQETQTMIERWKDFPLFKNDPAYPHYFRKDHQTFFDLHDPEKLW